MVGGWAVRLDSRSGNGDERRGGRETSYELSEVHLEGRELGCFKRLKAGVTHDRALAAVYEEIEVKEQRQRQGREREKRRNKAERQREERVRKGK